MFLHCSMAAQNFVTHCLLLVSQFLEKISSPAPILSTEKMAAISKAIHWVEVG